jgi:hypothetical protein
MRKNVFVLATVVLGVRGGIRLCRRARGGGPHRPGSFVYPARERCRGAVDKYVRDVARDARTGGYIDRLFSLPLLSTARIHRAAHPTSNNIGLYGVDFPSNKIRDRFVVLLTDRRLGSVAAQFGQLHRGGPPKHFQHVFAVVLAAQGFRGHPERVLHRQAVTRPQRRHGAAPADHPAPAVQRYGEIR